MTDPKLPEPKPNVPDEGPADEDEDAFEAELDEDAFYGGGGIP